MVAQLEIMTIGRDLAVPHGGLDHREALANCPDTKQTDDRQSDIHDSTQHDIPACPR